MQPEATRFSPAEKKIPSGIPYKRVKKRVKFFASKTEQHVVQMGRTAVCSSEFFQLQVIWLETWLEHCVDENTGLG